MLQDATDRDRKTQADWLLQEGERQFDKHQSQTAIEKWQQALAIYREIGDRTGENRSLDKIVSSYAYLTGWS